MALAPGTQLGRYQIHSALGAGGMGEVYRAKDLELKRDVAIKILPPHLSANSEARKRFEREARTISGLNHPNVCTLFDVGHQDGVDFLVMEYLEGETLQSRLGKGPLPLEQTVRYGAQIAHGLDKAHRQGIVHRDIKPGNIMLTRSGAKLLDFGLAGTDLLSETAATLSSSMLVPRATEERTIAGTLPYMSPEQVNGTPLDPRSDIFSLGAVLYEMATGRRAFAEKSPSGVLSAILEKEPETIAAIAPRTPESLARLIGRCLAKDPDDRLQSAKDLAVEMEWVAAQKSPSLIGPPQARKRMGWLVWMLCGAAIGAAVLAGILTWRSRAHRPRESFFLAMLPFTAHDMAIAPNGQTVAVVAFSEASRTNDLWLYEVGSQEQRKLPETQGARFPFWSPDGKTLGFFADGKLKKLALGGGPVQIICDAAAGRGGTWNKDGVIVFTPSGQLGGGLYRVPAAGGTATRVTTPDASRGENSDRWPAFLPDGKHFLYLAANVSGQTGPDAILVGTFNSPERKFLTRATGNAVYVAPGYLLFCRETTLYAQRFDPDKLELSGEIVPLLRDVSYLPRILHNDYASINAGVLVARHGSAASLSKLVWLDRHGRELGTVARPDFYGNLALAPGGNAVAFDKTDEESQNVDVWTYDLRRNSMKRLTFDPGIDADPVWSPDGTRLLFASSRSGLFQLYTKKADGGEEEKLLPLDASDKADKYPTSWSSDGTHLLYERATQPVTVWVAETSGPKTTVLLKGHETAKSAQLSPDQKWVAYTSNENGEWEIYVTSFPDARGKWQISNGGGIQPRWRGDGKELFYLAPDGKIMAVPVTAEKNLDAGTPLPLFQANAREEVAGSELVTYDVTTDGQRFLVNTQMEKTQTQPMTVVLNWPALLEK